MKIPYKIFGVAILVFTIMAASILFTTFKVYQVGEEVSDLTDIFVPLSTQLADIDIQIVTQRLHVERIRKHQADIRYLQGRIRGLTSLEPSNSATMATAARGEKSEDLRKRIIELRDRVAGEKATLEQIASRVEGMIQAAKELIDSASAKTAFLEARLELNSLLPLLVAVDKQHSGLHSQLVILTEIQYQDDDEVRSRIDHLIDAEEERLAAATKAIWTRIAHFTTAATDKTEDHQHQALIAGTIMTAIAGFVALGLSALVIKGILRPLRHLIEQAKLVQAGDLSGELAISTRDEIGDLTRSFNAMTEGLRRTEEIKEKFGQYVDPRVVSGLIGDPGMDMLQGEKKVVSVFFADLANFTGISERFTPSGLVKLINRYLEMMSEPVVEQHGLIDKYIGDGIMAFWANPFCKDGHQASLAVSAALKNAELIETLRQELPELTGLRRDLPDVNMRIGIATGDAIVGSIGSDKTKNYTVIGDTVNLGARLEGANKVYGTMILVCERTCQLASASHEFRKIDHLVVKGKSEPVAIFEPLGSSAALPPDRIDFRDRFEVALAAFQEGNWSEAGQLFTICADLDPDDPATRTYLERLKTIEETGAPNDWDGIWRLDTK